jgi:predicted  nucleic acid-binding Zn-ribbon protein
MFGQIQKKETGAIASILSDRLQDMETEKQDMKEINIKLTNEIRDVRKKMKKYDIQVN